MLAESVREWTQEWKNEGIEVGRKAQAAMVARQLELKFGSLPDEIRVRVESAKTDQLLKWSERLLSADSLDDIFQT